MSRLYEHVRKIDDAWYAVEKLEADFDGLWEESSLNEKNECIEDLGLKLGPHHRLADGIEGVDSYTLLDYLKRNGV